MVTKSIWKWHKEFHDHESSCSYKIALLPGSPLTPTKKKGGREPGIDLHVISQDDNVTAMILKSRDAIK